MCVCLVQNVINVDPHSAKMILSCEPSRKSIISNALDVQLVVDSWYPVRDTIDFAIIRRDVQYSLLILLTFYKGDEFALRDGGTLYCKEDHDVIEKSVKLSLKSIDKHNAHSSSITCTPSSTILTSVGNNTSSELGSMSGECTVAVDKFIGKARMTYVGKSVKSDESECQIRIESCVQFLVCVV